MGIKEIKKNGWLTYDFNPNHNPDDGKFASSGAAGSAGSAGSSGTKSLDPQFKYDGFQEAYSMYKDVNRYGDEKEKADFWNSLPDQLKTQLNVQIAYNAGHYDNDQNYPIKRARTAL
jgi:hypothetical protein